MSPYCAFLAPVLLKNNRARAPITNSAKTTTPTAIPAFAPPLRDDEPSLVTVEAAEVVDDAAAAVLLDVLVLVLVGVLWLELAEEEVAVVLLDEAALVLWPVLMLPMAVVSVAEGTVSVREDTIPSWSGEGPPVRYTRFGDGLEQFGPFGELSQQSQLLVSDT